MVLTILISAFVTLFLSVYVGISLLSSCVLCSAWKRSPMSAWTSLCVWVVGVVNAAPRIYVKNRFLFWCNVMSSEWICSQCTTCSFPFSRRTHLAGSLCVLIVLLRSCHCSYAL